MNTAQEYQAEQSKARQMLAEIQKLLAQHAEKQAKDQENWGYVGDIAQVVEALNQIKEVLS